MSVSARERRGAGAATGAEREAPRGTLAVLAAHVLRTQARGVVIWGLALGLYSAAMTASFATLSGGADQLNQLLEAYPQGMLDAFGITDLGDVENHLNAQVFILAPLALAFFPILAAAGTIAGAEERGTIDVLLGNPIRRWQLVAGSFVATAVSLLAIVVITGLLTWGAAALFDIDLSLRSTAGAVLNMWPICLFFGSLAMLGSAVFRRRALAIAVPAFLLFATYLLDTIGRASEDLEDLRPASVFYYYGSAVENGIDWTNFLGITGVALVFVALAAFAFGRRDIYT